MNPFLKVLTFCAVGILGVALVHAITPNLAGDSTTVLQAPAQPVPASLFAMNYLSNRVPYHPTSTTVVPWPTVPFDGVRIWHALWLDLEPQKGKWDFDHLDAVVNAALQNNSEVMLLLAYTPQWASSNPDPKSDWKPGSSGPLRDMNDWRTYVRTVATRYKGKIHVYEIWNEPDRPEDWTGGVDAMVQMVKEASIILKQVDPSITVVSPSATNPNGLAWLSEFLQRGGGQSVDVIGYHFYVGKPAPPEDRIERIQKVQALMRQYGVGDKPLWNTETGWIGSDCFPADRQAAYVARAYILTWAAGVSRFYWYAWECHHDCQIVLTENDGDTLTPAGKAYGAIHEWLVGATISKCASSGDKTWVCQLQRNGSSQYLVWNTEGDRSFRLPGNWRVAQFTQLDGTSTKITADAIQIGLRPVLVQ